MRRESTPELTEAIQEALRQSNLDVPIASMRDLSGGCIHRVVEVSHSDGRKVVAKANAADCKALFDEEMHGLRALAQTRTVVVPEPLGCVVHKATAVMLMTAIESPSSAFDAGAAWRKFGRDLAALHAADAGQLYGFGQDNHIGSTLQLNHWCDDWVEFNAKYRIGFQLETARERGLLSDEEELRLRTVIDHLHGFIPRRPKPALLHGDLWSGNAIPTLRQDANDLAATYAVIDPACSIGDGWADIAMMRLFGGFGEACFEEYARHNRDHENLDRRIAVYQLYHLLNHMNIFGRGYASQTLAIVSRLGF